MVDAVKNYGLAGVSANVELGKGGPRIIGSSDDVSLYANADTLATANIADGTDDAHAITKSQFEGITDPAGRVLVSSTINYNGGNVSLGNTSSNTYIHSVTVTALSNWTGADSSTNITVGDSGDIDRLFTGFDPDTQSKDETNHLYTSATELFAYVTTGGASAGTAKVQIVYSGDIS
jgi:hypothetical protein